MKNVLIAACAAVLVSTSAFAADRICDGAVSANACTDHRAYVASLVTYDDISPDYMKRVDPRYSNAMNTAGGGGSGGGAGASE